MGLEHGIEESLDVRYLVWCAHRSELGKRVTDAVYEGVDPLFCGLVLSCITAACELWALACGLRMFILSGSSSTSSVILKLALKLTDIHAWRRSRSFSA